MSAGKHDVVHVDKSVTPVLYVCSCGLRLEPAAMGEHQRKAARGEGEVSS